MNYVLMKFSVLLNTACRCTHKYPFMYQYQVERYFIGLDEDVDKVISCRKYVSNLWRQCHSISSVKRNLSSKDNHLLKLLVRPYFQK